MSTQYKAPTLTRRDIIRLTGAAALGLGAPSIIHAQGEQPIKIGMLFAKQGSWTGQGETLAAGVSLAFEQAGETILGRKAELLWYDEPNPQSAQQNMQKLIDEDKVVAVVGATNSASSLAMSAVARRSKVPYISPNSGAREITGKECNLYTFRTLYTSPVACRAMAPQLLTHGKRWHFLIADYAFGQDVYASMTTLHKEAGGEEVGRDMVPLNTTDFSSYILKIRQSNPDVVVVAIFGTDLSTFIKQWNDMGMKGRIPIANPIIGDSDLWALGPELITGYFGKSWHYNMASNPAADKAMVQLYQEKHGKPPADTTWRGWFSARALLMGIELAQSLKGADIVRGIEQVRIDDGGVDAYYRNWDHQLLRKCMVFKAKDEITDKWDWLDLVSTMPSDPADLDQMFGTPEEVGCKMESL